MNNSPSKRRWIPRLTPLDDRVLPSASPIGSELLVGTDPIWTATARDNAGDFVVAWWSNDPFTGSENVFARRYNAGGVAQGNAFQVNTTPNPVMGQTPDPLDVAMDGAGNFVVVWENYGPVGDGDGFGIVARRFDAAGNALGGQIQVNSSTLEGKMGDQRNPSIAMSAGGRFVVAWDTIDYDPTIGHGLVPIGAIHAQTFNSSGQPEGSNFLVSGHVDLLSGIANASDPSVAMDDTGNYVVAWVDNDTGNGTQGIYAKAFGAAASQEYLVNSSATQGSQFEPAVAASATGSFVITWLSLPPSSPMFLQGQLYDATGTPRGGAFTVNGGGTDSTIGFGHGVTMDDAGGFVVAWAGDYADVKAQSYGPDGSAQGAAFRVNTVTENVYPGSVDVASDAAGNVVVAWTGSDNTAQISGVFVQRFGSTSPSPSSSPVATPGAVLVGGTTNGTATVLNQSGGSYWGAGTVTFFPAFAGTVRTATADVTGDGVPDYIGGAGPGGGPEVAVIDGATGARVADFFAFETSFTGGVFVAGADLDGDGKAELIVTPDQGGGPRVEVFSLAGGSPTVRANFFGIDDPNFRGGCRAAAGDVNGDGVPDLAVAAGFLGGPRIAVFNGTTLFGAPARLVNDFFAFPGPDAVTLRNGAYVAAGDVNGDGKADLVFGGGPGGAPRVFILSGGMVAAGDVTGAQASPVANFFVAGNSADRGGVRVATKVADGDAAAEVVVGSGEGSHSNVRVYLGKNFTSTAEPGTFQDLDPYGAMMAGGVFVG